MSDDPKSSSNIDNDKVIEDLTKGLESNLIEPENVDSSDSEIEFAECEDETHPDFKFSPEKTTKVKEPEVDEEEKCKEDSDDDSDVELRLKDVEDSLTEEEKLSRKQEALQFKNRGNESFKSGEYVHSKEQYSEALAVCPLCYSQDRAILYANRAAALMKLDQNKLAIRDCTKAIENDPNYLKAYHRRAQCYELTEKLDESLSDFNKILELDPNNQDARRATVRLPPMIEERNEKLKVEMMSKLKDVGNLFLKPFGLSTDNFQMVQDPETKGYSINFKK